MGKAIFLVDHTNSHLVFQLPRSLCLRDVGLEDNAPDDAIWKASLDHELTIVTQNDRHFIALMKNAAQQSGRDRCAGDGFGLLVPNGQRFIIFNNLTNRLKYVGKRITWDDVGHFNLRVSLNGGTPSVTPLPRCPLHREECADRNACDLSKRYRELELHRVGFEWEREAVDVAS